MTRWPFYVLAGLAAYGLLSYGIARWDASISSRDAALESQFRDWRAVKTAWLGRYARVSQDAERRTREALRLTQTARATQARADSIRTVLVAFSDSLPKLSSAVDSLAVYAVALPLAVARGDSLDLALTRALQAGDSLALTVAELRPVADSAAVLLARADALADALNDARRCRVLFLPCPSRGALLVAGLLTGAAVGLAVR